MQRKADEIIQSAEFQALVATKGAVSAVLSVIMLAVYFGFILVLAFNKQILGTVLGPGMSLGIPVGLGVILLAWVLTGVYVFWANDKYDSAVASIRETLRRK